MGSLAGRFFAKVNRDGPVPSHRPDLGRCHVWTGAIGANGYGRFGIAKRTHQAHRVAFFLAEGRWPEHCALHRCDNRACVNRDHLFEGTQAENLADMLAKGRHSRAGARGERNCFARLTAEQVAQIRVALAAGTARGVVAARFGVDKTCIGLIHRRDTWKDIP